MLKYSTYKRKQKIKKMFLNVIIFLVKCIVTPMDLVSKIYDRYEQNKRYSKSQIRNVVKYLIDYWVDTENELYIIADDSSKPFDCSNVLTAFYLTDLSWYEHYKAKSIAFHVYTYQKDEYIQAIVDLCDMYGTKIMEEDKKKEFSNVINSWEFNKIRDRNVYKFTEKGN